MLNDCEVIDCISTIYHIRRIEIGVISHVTWAPGDSSNKGTFIFKLWDQWTNVRNACDAHKRRDN